MSIDNLPGEPGPVDDAPTSDQLVGEIADLLDDDPETDPAESEDQATAAATDDGDDPEIDVTEDVEDSESDENEDGSDEPEIKGGRFAPDTAKVKLEDGSVITVAELRRNNMFQRDYTKKRQEESERAKAVETKAAEVGQQAQSLTQLAERLTTFSQKYLPQPPEPFAGTPDTDPIGYMRYMQQREKYDEAVAELNGIQSGTSQLTEAQKREQEDQDKQTWATEVATLVERDKFFADPKKVKAFFDDAVSIGGDAWGLTAEDIGALRTHKAFLVLRDAVRYRKALAKAPEVNKQVRAKPVVAPGGRRADPNARVSAQKQARSEQLRRDGSFQAGVASLMDLDL